MEKKIPCLMLKLLFLMTLLFFANGCSSMKKPVLTLGEKENGSVIPLQVGDVVFVRVSANPTTGYLWKMTVIPHAAVMRIREENFESPAENKKRVGQGGTKVYHLVTVGPGKTGLRLEYRRPWETDRPPEKIIEYMFESTGQSPFLEDAPEDTERLVDSKGNILYMNKK